MEQLGDLGDTLRGAMTGVLEDDAYWIGEPAGGAPGDLEFATEDWSLVLEQWPDGIGYFAMDDEPDTEAPEELTGTLELLLGEVIPALAAVNEEYENRIGAALMRTSDPISNALAAMIAKS